MWASAPANAAAAVCESGARSKRADLHGAIGATGQARGEELVHVARLDTEGEAGNGAAMAAVAQQERLLERVLVPFAGDVAHPFPVEAGPLAVDLELLGEIGDLLEQNDVVHAAPRG